MIGPLPLSELAALTTAFTALSTMGTGDQPLGTLRKHVSLRYLRRFCGMDDFSLIV